MKAFLLLLIFWLSLAHLSAAKKIRWCTFSDAEQRKCSELSRALANALTTTTPVAAFGRVSCVRTRNTRDCAEKIRANKADVASLDAGDVYSGVKLHGLTVVAKEVYAEGNCVFAVAVARRGTARNIHRLKGSRSCHNGARWTSGWNIPLGFLLASGDLAWDKGQPLGRAVAEYFNASCVPGAGAANPRLCALCQGAKSYLPDRNHFCETNGDEPFYDSEGAFRCLAAGAADVAFVDHLAIVNASESDQEGFQLLCPDGSKAPLTNYASCNLGRGPGRALVTRQNFQKIARKFITVVQQLFGEKGKARFELFASAPFRGTNLLFRDATRRLRLVGEEADVSRVLGMDYVALLQGLGHEGSSLSDSVVRWCCVSDAEIRKCEEWALNVRSDPLVCVQADSMSNCIERIKKNEADAVTLDATHAFFAKSCALVPVAVENYESGPLFAVAAAKADAKGVNLHNLRGKRSCHGCEFCPAGWLLPSRYTVTAPNTPPENAATLACNLSAAYEDYFWKGCMPGADGNLCKVCVGRQDAAAAAMVESAGKESSKCAANHNERYYGNMGALRCLLGDPRRRSYGDVAFLEHHGLRRNVELLSGRASDFELLCPNGSRAAISDWRECNLGRVPPSVVVTRPVTVTKVREFLEKSQDAAFQLFQSEKYGESDLLFKDATRRLILGGPLDYAAILGESFFGLAESVFSCNPAGILDFCKRDSCADI